MAGGGAAAGGGAGPGREGPEGAGERHAAHHRPVEAPVGEEDLHGLGEAPVRGDGGEVEGIVDVHHPVEAVAGEEGAEPPFRGRPEGGQGEGAEVVGHGDALEAGVGDGGEAADPGRGRSEEREEEGQVLEVLEGVGDDDAGGRRQGAEDGVVPGDGGGVAGRGAGSRVGAPGPVEDHGPPGGGDVAGGLEEAEPVEGPEPLGVDREEGEVPFVPEVEEPVPEGQVHLVPQGDDEPRVEARELAGAGDGEGAALGEERHGVRLPPAGGEFVARDEQRVDAAGTGADAEAVPPVDEGASPGRPPGAREGLLHGAGDGAAPLLLLEPAGQQDHGLRGLEGEGLGEDGGGGGGVDGEDEEVHGPRQAGEAVHAPAGERGAPGLDDEDPVGVEAVGEEVLDDDPSRVPPLRDADHGDGAGPEHAAELPEGARRRGRLPPRIPQAHEDVEGEELAAGAGHEGVDLGLGDAGAEGRGQFEEGGDGPGEDGAIEEGRLTAHGPHGPLHGGHPLEGGGDVGGEGPGEGGGEDGHLPPRTEDGGEELRVEPAGAEGDHGAGVTGPAKAQQELVAEGRFVGDVLVERAALEALPPVAGLHGGDGPGHGIGGPVHDGDPAHVALVEDSPGGDLDDHPGPRERGEEGRVHLRGAPDEEVGGDPEPQRLEEGEALGFAQHLAPRGAGGVEDPGDGVAVHGPCSGASAGRGPRVPAPGHPSRGSGPAAFPYRGAGLTTSTK